MQAQEYCATCPSRLNQVLDYDQRVNERDVRVSECPLWESYIPIQHQGTGQQTERGECHCDDPQSPFFIVGVEREGRDGDRRDRSI